MSGELRVSLTALSPASMGDSRRQGDDLAVRTLTVRGVLRRWYRWYLLSVLNVDLRKVKEEERNLFGGGGRATRASSVFIKSRAVEKGEIELGSRDPFLWMLRKYRRIFHFPLKFELTVHPRLPDLWKKGSEEVAKAISLAVTFGGFGFRSARCYGSFRIDDYVCDGRGSEFLALAKKATGSASPEEWADSASELLKSLGVSRADWKSGSVVLPSAQSPSHSVFLTFQTGTPTQGREPWRLLAKSAESALRQAERDLGSGVRGSKVHRALLGMPIQWRGKASGWARARRASPLHLGLAGRPSFVRGILFLSGDYPRDLIESISPSERVLLASDFHPVLESLSYRGFDVW